jgi:molybdopterin-containing oxidoreductase family molybdopterin binding subunit
MSYHHPRRVRKPLIRTNPKKGVGVDPEWKEIGVQEATDLLVDRLKGVREKDPRKLALVHFDLQISWTLLTPWVSAFGTPNVSSGAAQYFCGPGVHPVLHMTQGAFVTLPDFKYCDYLILWGSQTGVGVGHFPILAASGMGEARSRGMKLVVVDPVCTYAAGKADEWIPIRPGTDAALALAMLNVLLNERSLYDADFLKRHTNGPYLVGSDGHYLRDPESGKPLVWDAKGDGPRPFDEVDPAAFALEGVYEVRDEPCRPAFQLLKDHVRRYTPEATEPITTVPSKTVRRLAAEFGEAARIGSTVVVDGIPLPYRPVSIDHYRGPSQHKHSLLNGIALQALNVVVGAIDVPGGRLGVSPVGPWWRPEKDRDGMLLRTEEPLAVTGPESYPARTPKKPETLTLLELMPVTGSTGAAFLENLLHPERYGVGYQPEVLLLCRANLMKNTTNPQELATALARIPLIVCFAFEHNETTEMADLVIPDAHFLERLDLIPNKPNEFIEPGPGGWYWMLRQPVVEPPPGVSHWVEFLYGIAGALGIQEDLYRVVNARLRLTEPYRLDPRSKHSWEEIADSFLKSSFGPERGLAYFKEHGFYVSRRKRVEEAYPRPFLKGRIPLYYEHFLGAGEKLRKLLQEMELERDWETEDYQPLPDWKPCPAYLAPGPDYDLFAVNYKLPTHTFSRTVENPWLREFNLQEDAFALLLHEEKGREKGLKEGDVVWVESQYGFRVKGRVKLTKGVHREVVAIAGGFGRRVAEPGAQGVGVDFNWLLPHRLDRMDTLCGAMDACVRVRIERDAS